MDVAIHLHFNVFCPFVAVSSIMDVHFSLFHCLWRKRNRRQIPFFLYQFFTLVMPTLLGNFLWQSQHWIEKETDKQRPYIGKCFLKSTLCYKKKLKASGVAPQIKVPTTEPHNLKFNGHGGRKEATPTSSHTSTCTCGHVNKYFLKKMKVWDQMVNTVTELNTIEYRNGTRRIKTGYSDWT